MKRDFDGMRERNAEHDQFRFEYTGCNFILMSDMHLTERNSTLHAAANMI